MAVPKKIQHLWLWSARGYGHDADDKVGGTIPWGTAAFNVLEADGSLTFQWADIEDAATYDLEIDTAPTFDVAPVLLEDVTSPYEFAGANDTTYYARLRGVDGGATPMEWLPTLSATPSGSLHDVYPHLERYPTVQRRLDQLPVMTLHLRPSSPYIRFNKLRFRQRIYAQYDDGSWEGYRVDQVQEGTVRCISIAADLQDTQFRYARGGYWQVSRQLPIRNIALDDGPGNSALDLLFDAKHGIPPLFSKGEVFLFFPETPVSFDAHYSTHWDLLVLLCEQVEAYQGLSCEIEPTFTGDPSDGDPAPLVAINLRVHQGMTEAERDELLMSGTPADMTLRRIDEPTGFAIENEGNLIRLIRREDQSDYFSRIVPLGGDEENPVGIGSLTWGVLNTSHDPETDVTTIISLDVLIWWNDMWVVDDDEYYFAVAAVGTASILGTFRIVGSSQPGTLQVEDPGNDWDGVDAGDDVRFRIVYRTPAGILAADFIPHPEEDGGAVERTVHFPEITPYENLFDTNGSSFQDKGDMSFNGAPFGFELLGGTSLTDVDLDDPEGPLYITYGTRVKKLEMDAGDAARFWLLALAAAVSKENPYISFWVAGQVTSGRVRITLVDYAGGHLPAGEKQVEMAADQTTEVALEGEILPVPEDEEEGNKEQLYIEALEDGTVFYLDAFTITNSAGAWRFTEQMGPEALYAAAALHLLDRGGLREAAYESEFIDLSQIESLTEEVTEVRLGSWVRVRSRYQEQTGKYLEVFDARVAELIEEDAPDGRFIKRVRLEVPVGGEATPFLSPRTERPDAARRLLPARRTERGARPNLAPQVTRVAPPSLAATPVWRAFAPDIPVQGTDEIYAPLDKLTAGSFPLYGVGSDILQDIILWNYPNLGGGVGSVSDPRRFNALLFPGLVDTDYLQLRLNLKGRPFTVLMTVRIFPDEDKEDPLDITLLRYDTTVAPGNQTYSIRFDEIPDQGSYTSPDAPEHGELRFRVIEDVDGTPSDLASFVVPSYYAYNAEVDTVQEHFYATDFVLGFVVDADGFRVFVNGILAYTHAVADFLDVSFNDLRFLIYHAGERLWDSGYGGAGIYDVSIYEDALSTDYIKAYTERHLPGIEYDVEVGQVGKDPFFPTL